jgi:hypothetical protein
MTTCDCCGVEIRFPQTECESQLYSPHHAYTLCEFCSRKEDSEVEKAGTNNLPELLATYRYNP